LAWIWNVLFDNPAQSIFVCIISKSACAEALSLLAIIVSPFSTLTLPK
jgi:hypothetical protein